MKSCLGRVYFRDKKCEAWKHEPVGIYATNENGELLPNYKHANWLIELKQNLWGYKAYCSSLIETFMFTSPDLFLCTLQSKHLLRLPGRKCRALFFFCLSNGDNISELHISSKSTIQRESVSTLFDNTTGHGNQKKKEVRTRWLILLPYCVRESADDSENKGSLTIWD